MKITKITKILPIALALSLTIGSAYAEGGVVMNSGEESTQEVNYTLTLGDYIRITTESKTETAAGTYSDTYNNLTLTDTMGALFRVYSNKPSRILTLSSVSAGGVSAIYGLEADTGSFNIVFVNTEHGGNADSVQGITSSQGSPSLADSPNAFALRVNSTLKHGHAVGAEGAGVIESTDDEDNVIIGITPSFDDTTKTIKYTMSNGIADINLTFGASPLTNTFDTRDTSGTYTANLVLTDSSGS